MESFNQSLFLCLNAPEHPNVLVLTVATFFAEWSIWPWPAPIGIGWLRGSESSGRSPSV